MLFKVFETGQWYEVTLRLWTCGKPSEDVFAKFERGVPEALGRARGCPEAILIPRKNWKALKKYWKEQVLLYNTDQYSEAFGQRDESGFTGYRLYIDARK